jgi:hypothetical protein
VEARWALEHEPGSFLKQPASITNSKQAGPIRRQAALQFQPTAKGGVQPHTPAQVRQHEKGELPSKAQEAQEAGTWTRPAATDIESRLRRWLSQCGTPVWFAGIACHATRQQQTITECDICAVVACKTF